MLHSRCGRYALAKWVLEVGVGSVTGLLNDAALIRLQAGHRRILTAWSPLFSAAPRLAAL